MTNIVMAWKEKKRKNFVNNVNVNSEFRKDEYGFTISELCIQCPRPEVVIYKKNFLIFLVEILFSFFFSWSRSLFLVDSVLSTFFLL